MRRAAKVDDNQKTIVRQLRQCGFSVAVTSSLGKGFPDLVVGWAGINLLVEIKDGAKVASQKKLTRLEQEFKDRWRGKVITAEKVEDILNHFKIKLYSPVFLNTASGHTSL